MILFTFNSGLISWVRSCGRGAPWHRVLGSSGKISLPSNGGGDRQRRLLEEEGVEFRESGAVAADTFWSRGEPFFAET